MPKTLSDIETRVRFEARSGEFSLTDTDGLALSNMVYRRISNISKWSELNREDVSLSTTADLEKYTWPATPIFNDVVIIEMQDPEDDLKYKQIPAADSEFLFRKLREEKGSFPLVYKRGHDGTNNVVYFAPKPSVGSLTIRISGMTQPTAFSAGSSTTVFLNTTLDDALEFMIAADIADKRDQPNRAKKLLSVASELLSGVAGREIVPAELKA